MNIFELYIAFSYLYMIGFLLNSDWEHAPFSYYIIAWAFSPLAMPVTIGAYIIDKN